MSQIQHNQIQLRASKIKNKTPAPIQVTAEQLLKDAQAHIEKNIKPTSQKIMDEDELDDYKLKNRKQFEDNLRRQKHHIGTWIKYAHFEEQLQEFRRARSIFERALEVDYKNTTLWLKYAEFEMKHKFINHARNIWERACGIMPRVDQFWYKYAYMEEMLGNYKKTRQIFETWMSWKPEEKAWMAYFKFEERVKDFDKSREVMYRYLEAYPRLRTYLKVTKFEVKNNNIEAARSVFEKAAEQLGELVLDEIYFMEFAKFELKNQEFERARQIFKFGLENLPKDKQSKLYEVYLNFEKQFGSKEEIDTLIIEKRRDLYKKLIEQNPLNYDAQFDLINLEMSTKNNQNIRLTYESAVKVLPPVQEKRFWRRYIYLWYNYAIFEELDAQDPIRAKAVYERALNIVPHKIFTFSKLWIYFANFHLRCQNLEQARKLYGIAIGKYPNEKIFQAYIDMEMQLTNIDRCRTLYAKYIETFPDNPTPWIKYAQLEKSLDEIDRFREIFELAIQQTNMNMPENIWKSYIDCEIQIEEYDRVRDLYNRLLEKTKHVKVWVSFAQFEFQIKNYDQLRDVLKRAETVIKQNEELKEERVMLLESWRDLELQIGNKEKIDEINKRMPKRVKKQRKIKITDGDTEEDGGWEEYYDYIFPDDSNQLRNMKILQKAYSWKKQVTEANK